MDEPALRKKVARHFGEEDISDGIWRELGYFVTDALDPGYEGGYGALVNEVARLRRVWTGKPKRVTPREQVVDHRHIQLSDAETLRSLVVSNALAKRAALLSGVASFRRTVIGDQPLSDKGALVLVGSPALAVLRRDELADARIPVLTHRAAVEGAIHDPIEQTATVKLFVDPPGLVFVRVFENVADPSDMPHVVYPIEGSKPNAYDVFPGSLLDELRLIALDVANRFFWTQEETTRFLLTSIPPRRRLPMVGWTERATSDQHTLGKIRLEIEPWVSADSVAATYRKLQQFMIGTGRDNRPVGHRGLHLFELIEDRRFDGGGVVDYEAVLADWNAAVPDQESYSDQYKLKRAYEQARDRLLHSQYHLPDDPPGGNRGDSPEGQRPVRTVFRWESPPLVGER